LGMILVWVFERTKSLLANILLHLSYNGCAMLQLLIPEAAGEGVWMAFYIGSIVVAAVGIFWFAKLPRGEEPVEEAVAPEVIVSEEKVQ